MKELALDEFIGYQFLSDIKYAPNGSAAAFVAAKANCDENNYERYLYVYENDTLRQLTTSGKEGSFFWDDDETLLFATTRDEADKKRQDDGEELTCFYRINIHGGEAKKAFCIPLRASICDKVNSGLYVLKVTYNLNFSKMYQLDESKKKELLAAKKAEKDYEVLDELPFYFNGQGFTNKNRSSIFLYDESNDEVIRVSEEKFSADIIRLSDDKKEILFAGEAYECVPKQKSGLYVYHIDTKQTSELFAPETYSIYDLYDDQDAVFFAANTGDRYGLNENPYFYRINKKDKKITLVKEYEDSIGNSVGSDCRLGGGQSSCYVDGTYYFITTIYNSAHVYALYHDGTLEKVLEKEGTVDCIDIKHDKMMMVGMYDLKLQEVYEYDLHTKDMRQITHMNEDILNDKYVAKCERLEIKSDDETIYGWVLKPKDFDPNKTYPAILDIHGGPKTVYGEVFYHEMQYWASHGYFVFFCNPRGGDGRGNEFADLRGKYGTIDYDDIMRFCDAVLAKYEQIDASKVGVTGGSYGGFMTNWIIGHSDRFAAAASQRSIANWIGFNFTSDIGKEFGKDQIQGDIWTNLEKLWFHSPLQYANNAVTPTLFIHSDEDYRCPLSEGIQMYSALMEKGVEARMCIFHGENHELSRGGKPLHRIRRLKEITDWMDHYLKG